MTSQTFEKPIRHTFFVAELKCYLCGNVVGTIESEQTLTPTGKGASPVSLREPGAAKSVQIANWRSLKCVRCAGPLFLDESDVITRRTDEYNWLDERPRRGRPPKRLLEERRREREQREQREVPDSQAA